MPRRAMTVQEQLDAMEKEDLKRAERKKELQAKLKRIEKEQRAKVQFEMGQVCTDYGFESPDHLKKILTAIKQLKGAEDILPQPAK